MATYDYEGLSFDRPARGVLRISIDTGDAVNALDPRTHRSLERVWHQIDEDGETDVVVVTGVERKFCGGGDRDALERMTHDHGAVMDAMTAARALVRGVTECEKVVVAAINGPAVGAGLALAFSADIAIAAADAVLLDGHLRVGIAPGDHAVLLWPLFIGLARARHLLLTGASFTGEDAARLGLVAEAVPWEELEERTLRLASELAQGPQLALRATKRTLNGYLRLLDPIFEASLAHEMLTLLSPDASEGVAAMRQRRRPQFPSSAASQDV